MRPEDIHEFTRKRPFAPYRMVTTEGRAYDIRHPDQVIVLRSRVIIGVGADGAIPDHSEHVALIHIVRLEELQPEAPASAS